MKIVKILNPVRRYQKGPVFRIRIRIIFCGKLDPDPHQSGKLDQVPHQSEKGHFGALEGPNLGKREWWDPDQNENWNPDPHQRKM
jgi:hypothetical protein